jgi:hypothetical protein
MPQIVDAEPAELRPLECRAEAFPQIEVIQVLAFTGENQITLGGELLPFLELRPGVDHGRHHRHRPDPLSLRHLLFAAGEVAPNVEQAIDEVNVRPAEG